MKYTFYFLLYIFFVFYFAGCSGFKSDLTPVGSPPTNSDPYLIVDRVEMQVSGDVNGMVTVRRRSPLDWIMPIRYAYAYTGTVAPSATMNTIVYNNPATTVGFTLNTSSLVAGSFTGDVLSYGSFSINGLDDNKLSVCPASGEANNGSAKCNRAKIRIYSTTGSVDGVFHNTTDGYYIPLMVSGIPVGVGVANAAYVQSYTILPGKNRLRASDLTGQVSSFPVTIDFSNGGAGSYSATLIVEYVLIKE